MIARGAAFDLRGHGYHLRIVISDPNKQGIVLVCNVTDLTHVPDCGCRIEPGEHDRITKPSGIDLRHLLELSVEGIERGVADGHLVPRNNFAPHLVERIVRAILSSRDVAPKFKAYLT